MLIWVMVTTQFYENYPASKDKEFVTYAGLVHRITPCSNWPGGPYIKEAISY
jgi:hypothetical protein